MDNYKFFREFLLQSQSRGAASAALLQRVIVDRYGYIVYGPDKIVSTMVAVRLLPVSLNSSAVLYGSRNYCIGTCMYAVYIGEGVLNNTQV